MSSRPGARAGHHPCAPRRGAVWLLILGQAALGILTLLYVVPFELALAHHAFAIVVLGFAVAHWRAAKGSYPPQTAVVQAG
jgi:heme a synthase